MPNDDILSKGTREPNGAGAPKSIHNDEAEEPVSTSLLADNENPMAPSTNDIEYRINHHAPFTQEWIKPTARVTTEKGGNSTPKVSIHNAEALSGADAQGEKSTTQPWKHEASDAREGPDLLSGALKVKNGSASPSGDGVPSQPARAVNEDEASPPSAHVSCSTATFPIKPAKFMVSEELLMAPTPRHILEDSQNGRAETKEPPVLADTLPSSANPANQYPESASQKAYLDTVDPAPINETMATSTTPKPLIGPPLCEGDTTLTQNFLPPTLIDGLFEQLCEEVHFKRMRHQGSEVPRFVAVQGIIDPDGTQPVYRHPSDESLALEAFTPAVQLIRAHVERAVGHPMNHVLIQCYRNSNDYISEHSDKTLDISRWSYIANVSIGAMRTMVFRTKRGDKKATGTVDLVQGTGRPTTPLEAIDKAATEPVDILKDLQPVKRQTTRCPMPHNSLIKMGLMTNEKWLHGIKPDKRPQSEKTAAELAWNGMRISLTFRYIATFLSPSPAPDLSSSSSEPLIWGQGAVSKTREHARPVLNGQIPEAIAMLRAFGRENNSPDFDWEASYGGGFDVLHMKAAPRYFGCGDAIVDGRVRIMLAECGVKYARGNIGVDATQQSLERGTRGAAVGEILPVRYVMDDADRTTVVGDVAILLFLDTKHPRKKGSDLEVAAVYSQFYAALALEQRWKSQWASAPNLRRTLRHMKPHLADFDRWAAETARGTSVEPCLADYALWPVLHDMALAWKSLARGRGVGHTVFTYLGLPAIDRYYREFGGRSSVAGAFGADVVTSVLPEPGLLEDDESDDEDTTGIDKGLGNGRPPQVSGA